MALDPKCFMVWAEEMSSAGDNYAAAVISFVGAIHEWGDIDAMRNLADYAADLSKRIEEKHDHLRPKRNVYVDDSGGIVPRVSSVVRLLDPNAFDHVSDSAMAVAAQRGTWVHEAIVPVPHGRAVGNALRPCRFNRSAVHAGILPVPVRYRGRAARGREGRHHGLHLYAGRLDRIYRIRGSYVLDFKVTAAMPKTVWVQLAAYAEAEKRWGGSSGGWQVSTIRTERVATGPHSGYGRMESTTCAGRRSLLPKTCACSWLYCKFTDGRRKMSTLIKPQSSEPVDQVALVLAESLKGESPPDVIVLAAIASGATANSHAGGPLGMLSAPG